MFIYGTLDISEVGYFSGWVFQKAMCDFNSKYRSIGPKGYSWTAIFPYRMGILYRMFWGFLVVKANYLGLISIALVYND